MKNTRKATSSLLFRDKFEIYSIYRSSDKRLILLDYDGTLVEIAQTPEGAWPSEKLLILLVKLVSDIRNTVVLISGRNKETLEHLFDWLNLILVAEHGAFVRYAKDKPWQQVKKLDESWMSNAKKILAKEVAKHKNSFIEEKDFSLVWHYRLAKIRNEKKVIEEISNKLLQSDASSCFTIKGAKKALDLTCLGVSKGVLVKKLTEKYKPDLTIAIGDDATDEDMFSALDDTGIGIKVGAEKSLADYRVHNVGEALSFLELLTS